jgi:hypothetical protein
MSNSWATTLDPETDSNVARCPHPALSTTKKPERKSWLDKLHRSFEEQCKEKWRDAGFSDKERWKAMTQSKR